MRVLYFPLLFVTALLVQSAVLPILLPDWFTEGFDFPLVVVVHVALTRGKTPGMMGGLVLGYLQDGMTGGILGINGIAKVVAGFTGGFLREKFFVQSTARRTACVAGAVLLSLISKLATLALFDQPRPHLFSQQFIWAFCGTTLLALVLHVVLERFESAFSIRGEEELSLGD